MMKNSAAIFSFLLAFMLVTLSGCQFIGDIFQAGMWVGIIVVVLVVAIIFYLISRIRKR